MLQLDLTVRTQCSKRINNKNLSQPRRGQYNVITVHIVFSSYVFMASMYA